MTETKKTLSILKARWPEVFLIVGFCTLGHGTSRLLMSLDSDSKLIKTFGCSSLFFFFSLYVISLILNLGFLRTVHMEGPKKHTPTDLLKTGKHFFWRMVGFSLIYGILNFILNRIILLTIIKNFTSIDAGLRKLAISNPLLYTLNISLSTLILIKIMLFIPSLIIVLDCRVFKSFDFLKKCKLSESKELVVLYFISIALPFVWVLLKIPYKPETISQYILRIGNDIIQQVIWFIIAVTAVRFVSSLDLGCDGGMKDLSSEDVCKLQKKIR